MNHSHAAAVETQWMASLRSSSTAGLLLRLPSKHGDHRPTAPNPRLTADGEIVHTQYVRNSHEVAVQQARSKNIAKFLVVHASEGADKRWN